MPTGRALGRLQVDVTDGSAFDSNLPGMTVRLTLQSSTRYAEHNIGQASPLIWDRIGSWSESNRLTARHVPKIHLHDGDPRSCFFPPDLVRVIHE